jgi:hypothetical protein
MNGGIAWSHFFAPQKYNRPHPVVVSKCQLVFNRWHGARVAFFALDRERMRVNRPQRVVPLEGPEPLTLILPNGRRNKRDGTDNRRTLPHYGAQNRV